MKAPLLLRHSILSWLVLVPLLLAPRAMGAQDAGTPDSGTPDAGENIPDASVGSGGADRDNPEGDDTTGQTGGACRSSTECASRFSCTQGQCRYTGIREADRVGCLLAPDDSLAMLGMGLVLVAGKRRQGPGRG